MNPIAETEIAYAEDRLRRAMLTSDVAALDNLLAPELIFTNHLGQLTGKQEELAAYSSGTLKVDELRPSEQRIQFSGNVAVVSVRTQLAGTYNGDAANGDFRFTRVWALYADNMWRVMAAHAGIVA